MSKARVRRRILSSRVLPALLVSPGGRLFVVNLAEATMGAILKDSGVAGPREEKVAMLARLSNCSNVVNSSARVIPTVTMFLAVCGGGIWMALRGRLGS